MNCDVCKATEGLENELWRRWNDGKVGQWALLIPQLFRHWRLISSFTTLLTSRSLASLSIVSVKSPTNFAQRPQFRLEILLHTVNLRQGTHGFTSLPKEAILRIFTLWKSHRLRPGLNPRISDPVTSMITTEPPGSTFLWKKKSWFNIEYKCPRGKQEKIGFPLFKTMQGPTLPEKPWKTPGI